MRDLILQLSKSSIYSTKPLMAERSGVRISDMLEKLINEHYRKMIGGE